MYYIHNGVGGLVLQVPLFWNDAGVDLQFTPAHEASILEVKGDGNMM